MKPVFEKTGFLVNIYIMKLKFFVNVYDDYDDKTRKAIEAHFGLDRLFSQEELEEFAKTLPGQYKSYILEQFDNVKDVELSETEVAPMKKEIMIEQRAVVKLADNSERRTRMTFFVTLDFNSLCDNIEYWYGMRERS